MQFFSLPKLDTVTKKVAVGAAATAAMAALLTEHRSETLNERLVALKNTLSLPLSLQTATLPHRRPTETEIKYRDSTITEKVEALSSLVLGLREKINSKADIDSDLTTALQLVDLVSESLTRFTNPGTYKDPDTVKFENAAKAAFLSAKGTLTQRLTFAERSAKSLEASGREVDTHLFFQTLTPELTSQAASALDFLRLDLTSVQSRANYEKYRSTTKGVTISRESAKRPE